MRLPTLLSILLLAFTATAQIDPNPRPAAPKPKPVAPTATGTSTVKVFVDAPCKFYVDGELKGTLTDGKPLRLNLKLGEYQFKAVSTEDAQDIKSLDYAVTRDELGAEVRCNMGLYDVIERRLRQEADERARQEQERVAREHAAAQERERLAQEEAERKVAEERAARKAQEADAARAKAEAYKSRDPFGIEDNMVWVAGGSFMMGCTEEHEKECGANEKPAHQVTLSNFYLSKHEVTQNLWKAVMGSNNPSKNRGCGDCPVENVSWNDIQKFITKLNARTGNGYRLPTEAEWEYAARGGEASRGTKYAGGSDIGSVGWYESNSGGKTHPVGQKAANELGLYDMSGNVWEWCSDWYGGNYYQSSTSVDPPGPSSGESRVVRGGSWDYLPTYCRVAYRLSCSPDYRYLNLGFRLARTP